MIARSVSADALDTEQDMTPDERAAWVQAAHRAEIPGSS